MPKILQPALFSLTLLVSALLVFSVQPMLGKMMLPHVGGSPAGWIVAMFFFQCALLAGYAAAFLFSKLSPLLNTVAIFILLAIGFYFLPITFHATESENITPGLVFIQLAISAAVPFIALSTLAPAVQRLFSFSSHATAGDPYYLYAASNAGSLIGLFSYPLLFEPLMGLEAQSFIWLSGYIMLCIFLFLCAVSIFVQNRSLLSLKNVQPHSHLVTHKDDDSITWKRRLTWLALAFIPSSLMLGVTTEITTDIASTPLLWVIPLGLYLLTHILVFSKREFIDTSQLEKYSLVFILAIVVIELLYSETRIFSSLLFFAVLFYLSAFFIITLTLHARLANDRPETGSLTEFYFFLALGGALGGGMNAFILPVILHGSYDFLFVLPLAMLFMKSFYNAVPDKLKTITYVAGGIAFISYAVMPFFSAETFSIERGAFVMSMMVAYLYPRAFFVTTLGLFILMLFWTPFISGDVYQDRNFFGTVKVYDRDLKVGEKTIRTRVLKHGTTLHGMQPLDSEIQNLPSSYYAMEGPFGEMMEFLEPDNVAAIGLGAGQVACHPGVGRDFTFYEIDPDIARVAKEHFTFLSHCGYKDIVIGDGRLKIAQSDEKYDLIILDAFTSDSIPVHLLTKEAMQTYLSKLKKEGVIAVHISNRYLDLDPVLAATARDLELHMSLRQDAQVENTAFNVPSEWVIISRSERPHETLTSKGWIKIKSRDGMRAWTDDYSNLLSALKFFKNNDTQNEPDKVETE